MLTKNTKLLRGISLGLTIVAVIAIIIALIVSYRKNGEINFVLIAMAAVLLSANFLVIKRSKTKLKE